MAYLVEKVYDKAAEHEHHKGLSAEQLELGLSYFSLPVYINPYAQTLFSKDASTEEKSHAKDRIQDLIERTALNPLIVKAYAFFQRADRDTEEPIRANVYFGGNKFRLDYSGDIITRVTTIPRIAVSKETSRIEPATRGGDYAAVRTASKEEGVVFDLVAFDGVTIPGKPTSDIASIQRCKAIVDRQFASETYFSIGSLVDWIVRFNHVLTGQKLRHTTAEKTKATAAVAEVTELSNGNWHVETVVAADAKTQILWINSQGELHVHTISNHLNQQIDRVTIALKVAQQVSGDPDAFFEQLIQHFLSESYEEKFNAGIPVLGDPSFAAKHLVTFSMDIPRSAKYWKVITHTDGVDLYAAFLGIPSWLCALLLEDNGFLAAAQSMYLELTFSERGKQGQPFLGTHPIGIATLLIYYALHHFDAYPIDHEFRGKADDVGLASVGSTNDIFFEYLQQQVDLLEQHMTRMTIPARQETVQQLVNWLVSTHAKANSLR